MSLFDVAPSQTCSVTKNPGVGESVAPTAAQREAANAAVQKTTAELDSLTRDINLSYDHVFERVFRALDLKHPGTEIARNGARLRTCETNVRFADPEVVEAFRDANRRFITALSHVDSSLHLRGATLALVYEDRDALQAKIEAALSYAWSIAHPESPRMTDILSFTATDARCSVMQGEGCTLSIAFNLSSPSNLLF
jgi:hypothetical protein